MHYIVLPWYPDGHVLSNNERLVSLICKIGMREGSQENARKLMQEDQRPI